MCGFLSSFAKSFKLFVIFAARRNVRTMRQPLLFAPAIATLVLCLQCAHSFAPKPPFSFHQRGRSLSLSATSAERPSWRFRGHDIYTEVSSSTKSANKKPVVLLIHGFGCSTTYWRETTSSLVAQGYSVHALDLLGQGRSDKPGRPEIEYSIHLWADLVDSYAQENISKEKNVVLIGNSLGSLVALSAATADFLPDNDSGRSLLKDRVKGICMFNCGIGLNSRGIAKEPQWNPVQRVLINVLFNLFDVLIFNNRLVLGYVLDKVVTKELLSNTLQSLYKCNPDRVDDELVESFYLPAKDHGSVEALSQIYVNDPGATPMELHDKHADALKVLPIHLVWGDEDAVTPITGSVGQFYLGLAADDDTSVSLDVVQSGHVPFDDSPVQSNEAMLQWLEEVVET